MKILVAGDYVPSNRLVPLITSKRYDAVFNDISPLIKSVDYSIVNFECPIVKGGEKPIEKVGPNLCCSEHGMEAIKWVGFHCITLANNHLYDFGNEGVANTIEVCEKYGMDFVGGGRNIDEASRVLYKKIGNQTLGIVNCCEHEFSIATETSAGSNPLNSIQQFYAIKEAKSHADYVLVIVHGGHEHWQLPSPRMKETYRFFVDAGADAVVNHHQHCYSGYEVYNGKLIFYGVGNFCFDKPGFRNGKWNEGYMVMLSFDKQVEFEIYPYRQCDVEPKVVLLEKNAYKTKIIELSETIVDDQKLFAATEQYYKSCAIQCSNIFEPVRNRFYLAVKQRGWFSSLISKKRKLQAENYICCESHRDKVTWYLCH